MVKLLIKNLKIDAFYQACKAYTRALLYYLDYLHNNLLWYKDNTC